MKKHAGLHSLSQVWSRNYNLTVCCGKVFIEAQYDGHVRLVRDQQREHHGNLYGGNPHAKGDGEYRISLEHLSLLGVRPPLPPAIESCLSYDSLPRTSTDYQRSSLRDESSYYQGWSPPCASEIRRRNCVIV
jgi:hypothetical protein